MWEKDRLYFEDCEMGWETVTGSRTVTEADIVNFAGVSGDYNPLHMDEEFAKKTPFGKRIAHGLLGMSIGTGLPRSHPPLAIMAFLGVKEWTFKAPIFIGDTIHMKNTVVERRETSKKDRGLVTFKRQIINQKGEVVQEGEALLLIQRREK